MKVLFLIDGGDAHGLSLHAVVSDAASVASKNGNFFTDIPATLGELPQKLNELLTLPPFLKPDVVVIADLPFTSEPEKSIEAIKKLTEQGIKIFIFDHHADPKNTEVLEKLEKIEGVSAYIYQSAYQMNKEFMVFLQKEFGARPSMKTMLVAAAGAVADMDCEALRRASGEERELAKVMDYLIRKHGLLVALQRLMSESKNVIRKEMMKYDEVSSTLEKIKAVADIRGTVAILPYNFKAPALNKGIAAFIAEGSVRYVVVPVNSFNPRSKKYSASLLVYTSPCGNVMNAVRQALPNAKVVGHPSFAIAILKESDRPIPDEEARAMLNDAVEVTMSALS